MVEKYLGKEANEKTTIVNATKELLQKIDVAEAPDEHIGNFFNTLNTYEENDKLQLLHDVLKDGEIKIGSGGFKTLKEVANDFSEYVKQEGSSWQIKAEGLPEDGSKAYLEQFLNQGNSSLAYLIQKTANFINVQAKRGYGNEAEKVDKIAEDKKFGNQTRRALAGLKSWVESSNSLTFDAGKTYTEGEIKGMKFVSKEFLEKLKTKNAGLFEKFWKEGEGGTFLPAEGKKFAQEWSNNYAIKEANDNGGSNTENNNTGGTEQPTNDEVEGGEAPADLKIDQFLAQQILTATNKTNATLDYFGEKKAITINIPTTTTYYSASYGYINTIQQSDYEHLSLSIGTTSTLINVKDLLDAKGDFNENKWNTKLGEQKEILINKLIAQTIAKNIRGKKYNQEDIFPEKLKPGVTAANITKYFSQFYNSLLEIDDGTSHTKETDGNLNITLNNLGRDKAYNKPKSNERLKITPEQYKKFLPSGKFEGEGETAFKAYLQKVVLNIVESRGT